MKEIIGKSYLRLKYFLWYVLFLVNIVSLTLMMIDVKASSAISRVDDLIFTLLFVVGPLLFIGSLLICWDIFTEKKLIHKILAVVLMLISLFCLYLSFRAGYLVPWIL